MYLNERFRLRVYIPRYIYVCVCVCVETILLWGDYILVRH